MTITLPVWLLQFWGTFVVLTGGVLIGLVALAVSERGYAHSHENDSSLLTLLAWWSALASPLLLVGVVG